MSYEHAVAWSILRSLLGGVLCWGFARVLLRWKVGSFHHGGTEARRSSGQRSAVSGQPEEAHRLQPVSQPHQLSTLNSQPSSSVKGHRVPVVEPLTGGPGWRVELGWALLIVPFFVPGLVVGYAYRNASLSLVHTPLLNELLYLAIVVAQLTPIALLALEWLPAATLGQTGAFLLKLTTLSGRSARVGERLRILLAGELPRQLTAGAIAALLCFQEVEVATLMQARGWAEWIFTKQAGGVELVEVWPFLIGPLGYGLCLTVPLLAYWMSQHANRSSEPVGVSPQAGPRDWTGGSLPRARLGTWLVVAVSWLLTVIWPVTSLVIGAFWGHGVIQFRSAIWQEIGDSLVLGVTVTVGLWLVLWGVEQLRRRGSRRAANEGGTWCQFSRFSSFSPAMIASDSEDSTGEKRGASFGEGRRELLRQAQQELRPPVAWYAARIATLLILIPGLLGSLALGLTIYEICQRMRVQPSYSPLPLVAGMVLFLLPRALALQAMLRRNERQAGVFLAEELARKPGHRGRFGQAILWRIRDAGRFWTLALLFWWSYLELTLPSLLRPAGMAPAPLRLYNFLHYGHIPGLAAMLVVVLAVPVGVMLVGRGLWIMIEGFSTKGSLSDEG